MTPEQIKHYRIEETSKGCDHGFDYTPLNDKRPIETGWQKAPRRTKAEVIEIAAKGNVGIRTGRVSGIVVVDDDTGGSGAVKLNLPMTPTVITGSDKRHYYFRCPDGGLANSVSKVSPGVDIRGDRGVVVAPGSTHPDTGRPYLWASGLSPDDVPFADLPDHVLLAAQRPKSRTGSSIATGTYDPGVILPEDKPALARYARISLGRDFKEIATCPEGMRNSTLNRTAYFLAAFIRLGFLNRAFAEDVLTRAAKFAGLDAEEIERTIRSAIDAGMERPLDIDDLIAWAHKAHYRLTDTGNAERFADMFGSVLRYCPAWKKWLAWDGVHWAPDASTIVMELTKHVVQAIRDDAPDAEDEKAEKALKAWAHMTGSSGKRTAMIGLARSETGIAIDHEKLDSDPWLLNLPNGTLDLRTAAISPHQPQDLITQLCPVRYDPNAQCPRWNHFLARIIPDEEIRDFLQRAVGATLTGEVGDQVLIFLYGLGANGKTVFLTTLQRLLGRSYAIQSAPEILLERGNRSHPTEIADLFRIRLAVCTEIGANRFFDEVQIKQLTGGDRIRARRLYEDFWEFDPTHHLWIAANHKPVVRGTDEAIWRRILLIPFTITIPAEERDASLAHKLRDELPGILTWAVRGCLEWQREGLRPPMAVRLATEEYRGEMDLVGDFLEARCEQMAGATTSAKDLYDQYESWCRDNNEQPLKQRTFGRKLTERGLRRVKRGIYLYEGISLRFPPAGGSSSGVFTNAPSLRVDLTP